MDPYMTLTNEYAKSRVADVAHSALPDAPRQPYRARPRRWRGLVAAVRRSGPTRRHVRDHE